MVDAFLAGPGTSYGFFFCKLFFPPPPPALSSDGQPLPLYPFSTLSTKYPVQENVWYLSPWVYLSKVNRFEI